MLKSFCAVSALVLCARCSQATKPSHTKDVVESIHETTPSTIECLAAQTALNTTPVFFGLIYKLEVTNYLGDFCTLNVKFTSTANMLRFIEARMTKELDPTITIVRSSGKLFEVVLLLEVEGEVKIPTVTGLPPTDPAKRADTIEIMKGLQKQLEERSTKQGTSYLKFDIDHISITGAQSGLALHVSFLNSAGLRDFVSNAADRGVFPSPFGAWYKGVLYYTPVVLEVLGDEHGLPSATVVSY